MKPTPKYPSWTPFAFSVDKADDTEYHIRFYKGGDTCGKTYILDRDNAKKLAAALDDLISSEMFKDW